MIALVADHIVAYVIFVLVTVVIWQMIDVFITTPYFIYSVYFAPRGISLARFLAKFYRYGRALPQASRVVLNIASAVIYSYFFLAGRFDVVLGWFTIMTAFDFLNVQLVAPEVIRFLEEDLGLGQRPTIQFDRLIIIGNGADSALLIRLLHTAYFIGATLLFQRIFPH